MAISLGSRSGQRMVTGDMLQGGSAGIPLQGSSPQLQGNTRSVQGSSPSLQVTNNPYSFQPSVSSGISVGGSSQPTSGGGGTVQGATSGGYDPQAAARAQQAAAEAAEAARRQQLQGGIQKLIKDTLGIYDQLYGDVRGAAKSQNQLLNQRFNREVGGLTDQFNQEMPKIGEGYASRGAFHSSYREGSEDAAQKGFEGQIQGIGEQRAADAAKIGQFVREQESQFGAQKKLLNTMRKELGQTEDVGELRQIQRDLQRRIADLEGSRGGLQSREAYTQRLGEIAPNSDRMGQLSQTLTSLIQGQAPAQLKRAVAQEIIGSAGLPPAESQRLLDQVNSQIG